MKDSSQHSETSIVQLNACVKGKRNPPLTFCMLHTDSSWRKTSRIRHFQIPRGGILRRQQDQMNSHPDGHNASNLQRTGGLCGIQKRAKEVKEKMDQLTIQDTLFTRPAEVNLIPTVLSFIDSSIQRHTRKLRE